jgi:hypothetical protein
VHTQSFPTRKATAVLILAAYVLPMFRAVAGCSLPVAHFLNMVSRKIKMRNTGEAGYYRVITEFIRQGSCIIQCTCQRLQIPPTFLNVALGEVCSSMNRCLVEQVSFCHCSENGDGRLYANFCSMHLVFLRSFLRMWSTARSRIG